MTTNLRQRPENNGPTTDGPQAGKVLQARDLKDPEPGVENPRSRNKWLVVALCLLVVVGAVWAMVRIRATASKTAAAASARTQPAVPVVAGTVTQTNLPIYLNGLGTVQAFNTVTVHSRVDGQLQKVAFVEGQDVRAGDLLAQIDPGPYQALYEQNLAKKRQDEAQLNLQRVELKRETELLAAKIDSQDTYDQVAAQVKQLEAAVNADQAAIDSAKVQLDYTTMVSPIDGRVGIRQVDVGNIIHATDSNGLVIITQLHPISVLFTLPEQTLGEIHRHMASGELTVLATDREDSRILDRGKLAVVDNQIDTTTGTIKLKANFPNPDLRLWPGQFVNTRLLLTVRTNGIVVPEPVIQRGPGGAFAFVIGASNTVSMQSVKVAQIQDGLALIDAGLSPGDRVVVDGQYRLQPGSSVKIAESGGKPANSASGRHHPAVQGAAP